MEGYLLNAFSVHLTAFTLRISRTDPAGLPNNWEEFQSRFGDELHGKVNEFLHMNYWELLLQLAKREYESQ